MHMSLLGLGDIVIPGIFVALLLRFDEHMCKLSDAAASASKEDTQSAVVIRRSETYKKRLYFAAGMIGYLIGIASTLVVMLVFEAAQPALLYIVPSVITVPLVTAALHKEIGMLLSFTEGEAPQEGAESAAEGEAEAKKEK